MNGRFSYTLDLQKPHALEEVECLIYVIVPKKEMQIPLRLLPVLLEL